jgi:hypothetical protein
MVIILMGRDTSGIEVGLSRVRKSRDPGWLRKKKRSGMSEKEGCVRDR